MPRGTSDRNLSVQNSVSAAVRRAALLKILLQERYLTSPQLRVRVQDQLGQTCFSGQYWTRAFFRDVRVVKTSLKESGLELKYSRNPMKKGYFLEGQGVVSKELSQIFKSSVAEVDSIQLSIFLKMTPADRFRLGCSVTDSARNAVAYRIRNKHPELSIEQASFLALQGRLPE
jgi:hypothetical protein